MSAKRRMANIKKEYADYIIMENTTENKEK